MDPDLADGQLDLSPLVPVKVMLTSKHRQLTRVQILQV
jgi:hypothetical protein